MREYMENGVLLGLLIDPRNRRVHVYRSDQPVEILEEPSGVSADPVLAGLHAGPVGNLVGRFDRYGGCGDGGGAGRRRLTAASRQPSMKTDEPIPLRGCVTIGVSRLFQLG